MMSAPQPFHPQNPVPFGQPAGQFGAPESHFGQVDVNDLLSKLISTGIIAGSAPVQPEDSKAAGKGERVCLSVCLSVGLSHHTLRSSKVNHKSELKWLSVTQTRVSTRLLFCPEMETALGFVVYSLMDGVCVLHVGRHTFVVACR